MSKFIVKKGCLCEDGKKIIPEFGNIEHIKAVRLYEKKLREFKSGVEVSPEHTITAKVKIVCICGRSVSTYENFEIEDLEDVECFNSTIMECSKCCQKYQLKNPRNTDRLLVFAFPILD